MYFQTTLLKGYATVQLKNIRKTRVSGNGITIVDGEIHVDFMSCHIMLLIQ